jgi:hypothetical protein
MACRRCRPQVANLCRYTRHNTFHELWDWKSHVRVFVDYIEEPSLTILQPESLLTVQRCQVMACLRSSQAEWTLEYTELYWKKLRMLSISLGLASVLIMSSFTSVRHSQNIITWQLSPEFFHFIRTSTKDHILLIWIWHSSLFRLRIETENESSGKAAGFRRQRNEYQEYYGG